MNLVVISSLATKCQDFKVEMPFFQPLYVMKLKTSKFKVLVFCCQWRYITKFKSQGPYIIKIKYWNASGSGFPPSLIPALLNIGILHHKMEKLRILSQHSVHVFLWILQLRLFNKRGEDTELIQSLSTWRTDCKFPKLLVDQQWKEMFPLLDLVDYQQALNWPD